MPATPMAAHAQVGNTSEGSFFIGGVLIVASESDTLAAFGEDITGPVPESGAGDVFEGAGSGAGPNGGAIGVEVSSAAAVVNTPSGDCAWLPALSRDPMRK